MKKLFAIAAAAVLAFSLAACSGGGADSANIPTLEVTAEELAQDARVTTLLVRSGLCKSQSVARQQIEQNAVSLDGEKVTDPVAAVSVDQVSQGLLLKKGKKGFCRVVLK